jgi:NADH-quinone oxidoreductase subunit E
MLTREEREEIEAELTHYPDRRALATDALKTVQRHRGWVSDDALRDVAALLEMTPDELDSVATFYNMIFRQPVGRHVIVLCDSVSCWLMGAERIRDGIAARLRVVPGETSAHARFTLLPIVCLGTCDHAPAMMVDGDLHRDLDPEQLDAILDRYR